MPRSFADLKAIRLERRATAMGVQGHLPSELHARHGFDPNQPRVPAGHSDGGQWTSDGARIGIRLASADKPGPGPRNWLAGILLHLAMGVIEAYRSENGLRDLFGHKFGTVTWIKFNGKDIFGSNSSSPTYTRVDRGAAERMRGILEVSRCDEAGQYRGEAQRRLVPCRGNDHLEGGQRKWRYA